MDCSELILLHFSQESFLSLAKMGRGSMVIQWSEGGVYHMSFGEGMANKWYPDRLCGLLYPGCGTDIRHYILWDFRFASPWAPGAQDAENCLPQQQNRGGISKKYFDLFLCEALMPWIFSVNHVFGTFYLVPQGRRDFLVLFTNWRSS